jgi:hypothetical protein
METATRRVALVVLSLFLSGAVLPQSLEELAAIGITEELIREETH